VQHEIGCAGLNSHNFRLLFVAGKGANRGGGGDWAIPHGFDIARTKVLTKNLN